jgi:hypothetical protein
MAGASETIEVELEKMLFHRDRRAIGKNELL